MTLMIMKGYMWTVVSICFSVILWIVVEGVVIMFRTGNVCNDDCPFKDYLNESHTATRPEKPSE